MAGNRLGQRGLPGPVGPHDGVDLAGIDRQGDTLDDFLVPSGDVQVLDFEGGHALERVQDLGCALPRKMISTEAALKLEGRTDFTWSRRPEGRSMSWVAPVASS